MGSKLKTMMVEAADPSQVPGLSRFFKTGKGQYGEGDKFLGIKVPVTRSIVKECWKETSFEDLEECITIAEIFLAKPRPLHDLLQKAVGWLLREAGKRDEERLVAWLRANWTSMPCTMRRYAVERLSREHSTLLKNN